MISSKELQHIAKLARLGFGPSEVKRFQEELSSILDYLKKLKEVDVSEVKPTSYPFLAENVMRDDKVTKREETKNKKLLDLAPEIKEGYFKTKSILK